MSDNQRQCEAEFRQVAGEFVQQQKQLLIQGRKTVLFAARRVGGHRRDCRRDKLVEQYAAGTRLRVIADQQDHHKRQETAHQLAQRAVEELAEMEGHRVIKHDDVDRTRQRPQRTQPPFLHFNTNKERQHGEADAEQQHALLC